MAAMRMTPIISANAEISPCLWGFPALTGTYPKDGSLNRVTAAETPKEPG